MILNHQNLPANHQILQVALQAADQQLLRPIYFTDGICTFSALTLLVGWQEGHLACKKRVVGCWHGYQSGARCRLAYGQADATATHCLLLQKNPGWFYLSGTGSPG